MESYKDSMVYKEHEKIGFPQLSKKEQFDLLINHNYDIIQNLIPEIKHEPFPLGIIRHYITVSISELEEYLKNSNYIQNKIEKYKMYPTSDGTWIIPKEKEGRYEVVHQERGTIYERDLIESYEELIKYFAKFIGRYWVSK